jgi:hypothetical protein
MEGHPTATIPPGGKNHVGQFARPGTAFRGFQNERRSTPMDAIEGIKRASSPSDEHVRQQNLAGLLVKV